MHDRRSPSRSERRIALSFAFALLPALAGCGIYDSAVYGNRRGVVEQPGSGSPVGDVQPSAPGGPSGPVQSEALPPPPGAGSEPPGSAAGSLPPVSGSGPPVAASPSGTPPPFGSQTPPPPVPLPRGGGTQVASADPAAPGKPRFEWPVRGKVVSSYGQMPGGRRNDGIDIAAPSGAPVKAADGGTVVYAGSEVKGLGNLVLISHPGGYVTAYAHAEQILVKKDEAVRRGQTIATVGQSGDTPQPVLHFEVRQANKPVDPTGYLPK